jgi:hypothetical protein
MYCGDACAAVSAQKRERRDVRNAGWSAMQLFSTITCPACGHHRMEEMPEDACRFFYDCTTCGVRMKPKPGDCCVFCSYGDVRRSKRHARTAIGLPAVARIEDLDDTWSECRR